MKKLCFIFFNFFGYIWCADQEFLYPIEKLNSKNVFLLHQRSLYSIDLLIWDSETKIAKIENLNFLVPGNLKLLPNLKGFSFIYNKKIRVKYFDKTILKAIGFFEPIYDIGSIEWVNNSTCYFSAKQKNSFCIFQTDIKNQKTQCIYKADDKDDKLHHCLFPQKVGSNLYYIEQSVDENYRTTKYRYKIVKTRYPNIKEDTINLKARKVILDFGNSAIAFLKMISDSEGYFIEHPISVDRNDKTILMTCHRIIKNGEDWQNYELFNFYLPTYYLYNKNYRLYESILPFLPKYTNGKLVFCSCIDEKNIKVDIYIYDLVKKYIDKKTNAQESQMFFAPIVIGDKVFYGYSINSKNINASFEQDQAFLKLPSFSL